MAVNRKAVRTRDSGRCRGCGEAGTQIHHIKFRSQGGTDANNNLALLCLDCHQRAHNLHANNLIKADTLRAAIRLDTSVRGLRYMKLCYTCANGAGDYCQLWEMEVLPDYVCNNWQRNAKARG